MSTTNSNQENATISSRNFLINVVKIVLISGIVIYIFYIFFSTHPYCQSSTFFTNSKSYDPPTNIGHLVFGIAGSTNTWRTKRAYIESWFQPNKTRGYLYLDRYPKEFLPWPSSSPPFRVSEDTSRFNEYNKHRIPFIIRIVRVISEIFREENQRVRWYVMGDDDTVFFLDNLVDVLRKYDHRKYFYIGMNSEGIQSNTENSFAMAFGGAGYALSYPLAEALEKNIDICIKRYPTLKGSDHILQSCIADIGVSLTQEQGFHQV